MGAPELNGAGIVSTLEEGGSESLSQRWFISHNLITVQPNVSDKRACLRDLVLFI